MARGMEAKTKRGGRTFSGHGGRKRETEEEEERKKSVWKDGRKKGLDAVVGRERRRAEKRKRGKAHSPATVHCDLFSHPLYGLILYLSVHFLPSRHSYALQDNRDARQYPQQTKPEGITTP